MVLRWEFRMTARHSIKAVARKTGISPYLLRAWERRYKAVDPERTPTNRRLYSDEDIERLTLLYKATLKGESIGQVAGLPTAELRELVGENSSTETGIMDGSGDLGMSERETLERILKLTASLDRDGLYRALLGAETRFSKHALLNDIVIPFLQRTGDGWQDGSLRVVHEHLASAVIRSFLGELLISYKPPDSAPSIITTTLRGQHHEFGAVISALTALSEGWRGTYLGPDLPADDIAHAAVQHGARAIALSLVYPSDDPHVKVELKKLRRLAGDEIGILAGGRSVESYVASLDDIDAVVVRSMVEFRDALRNIRNAD
jgi:DNA-binding transcriptional MerR regulator/methylmalonyl-CoA mutase cobalamin-binding subunit